MRSCKVSLLAVFLVLTGTSCATILGGGTSQGLGVTSNPTGANFVIKSSSGLQFAAGMAPQMVSLPRKHEYLVEFTVPGYQPQSVVLTKGINGWIWGNLIVGWVVGFAIDFISGSAYKLEPSQVSVSLVRAAGDDGEPQLFGRVQQLDTQGRVLSDQRVPLVPAR